MIMSTFLLTSFLVAFVLLLMVAVRKYKRDDGVAVGAPRLSLQVVMRDRNTIDAQISSLIEKQKAKAVVLTIPFMKPAVLVLHPDLAKTILKDDDNFPKGQIFRTLMTDALDDSLATVNGDIWKHQRTIMSPAFHFDYLKGMMPVLLSKTQQLFDKFPKGELFDTKEWLYHFTVDVLGLAAFGVDFNTMNEGAESQYFLSYKVLMDYALQSFNSYIPPWVVEQFPLPSVRKARAAKEKLMAMTHDIMESRKKATDKTFLIDMMLGANPALTMRQFETNTFLFFIAGHETTASALNWALYLLAKFPIIQGRVREEVDRILNGKHPDSEQLKDLVYLDMFIKEVMRYGTPVSMLLSRKASKDIYVDDYFLPKDTLIGVGMYAIHHHPDFYPSPEVFDPERFNPNVAHKQHPFAYLPFSLGKRVCIGNNFSLIEQKVFLSMLMQQFVVSATEDYSKPMELDPVSVARVPKKVNIILKKRT